MRKLLLLPVFALVLAACGGNGIQAGTVYAKDHQPASTTTMIFPMQTGQVCSGGGTSTPQICTPIYTYIPYVVYDDEDWVVRVKDDSDKHHGQIFVTEEEFNRVHVGEYYDASQHDVTKDPVKKLHKAKKGQS